MMSHELMDSFLLVLSVLSTIAFGFGFGFGFGFDLGFAVSFRVEIAVLEE